MNASALNGIHFPHCVLCNNILSLRHRNTKYCPSCLEKRLEEQQRVGQKRYWKKYQRR